MDFKEWHEEADMPMKDENGKWYDAETGLAYENYKIRNEVSEKTKEIRKEIKKSGAKSLKGTKAQKDWAEKIRLNFFNSFDEEMKSFYSQLDKAQYSAFWINLRDKNLSYFQSKIKEFFQMNDLIKAKIEEFKNSYTLDSNRIIQKKEGYDRLKSELRDLEIKGDNLFR